MGERQIKEECFKERYGKVCNRRGRGRLDGFTMQLRILKDTHVHVYIHKETNGTNGDA